MLMARSQTGCDTDCDLAGDISLLLLELENSFKMGQNKSKRPWCTMAMLKSQTGCDTVILLGIYLVQLHTNVNPRLVPYVQLQYDHL